VTPVTVRRGAGPILLALPHTGAFVPADIATRLNANGRALADTDWHIDKLYRGLRADLTVVRATFHRYVIDANRAPDGASLYPGQNTTGLVPLTDFDGAPLWTTPPDAAEAARRRAAFHAPYHAALAAEMARIHARHGIAILYDAHSIRSRIPYLFDGILPDFNIGTNDGAACAAPLAEAVAAICARAPGYTSVTNGRFKGGWTTRHYGRPAQGWHAIQMELAQSTYLDTEAAPFAHAPAKARRLRAHLREILNTINDLAPTVKAEP